VATNPVRNLIRENKSQQLQNVMMTSRSDDMITLERSLGTLVAEGTVSYEEAQSVSAHPKELAREIEAAKKQQGAR
jgi:twitching motility protein PilT